MPASTRTSVFISYSHADEKWRNLLETHLAPLGRDHQLRVWSDKSLKPGEPWLTRIKRELATARVGIMLVSHHFMASGFIHSDELPPLLQAARQEGVTLLTVVVGHCHFANSPLSKLQAFNKPDKPLEALTIPQRNKEMARLCALLMKIFGLKPGAAKPAVSKAVPAKRAAARKVPKPASTAATPKAVAPRPKATVPKAPTAKPALPKTKAPAPSKPAGAPKPAARKKAGAAATAAPKSPASKTSPAPKTPRQPTAPRPATTRAKKK